MRRLAAGLLITALATPLTALAAPSLNVTLDIPRMNVAEYHVPYVAVWLEPRAGGAPVHLAVWYDTEMRNNEGLEWLKDLRLWWRKGGRGLDMPVDGVSGATRQPGRHTLTFVQGRSPLGTLAAGDYVLHVEAAREVGGREVVSLPFSWPAQAEHDGQGSTELGAVRLQLTQ